MPHLRQPEPWTHPDAPEASNWIRGSFDSGPGSAAIAPNTAPPPNFTRSNRESLK
jgi:hypothetical protein